MLAAVVRTLLPVALSLALLAGCGDGGSGASPSSAGAAGTAAGSGAASAQPPAGGTRSLSPAHGLTLTLPASITSDAEPWAGSNGKLRIDYYVADEDAPAMIDVEYYTEGAQTAAGVVELDRAMYADMGVDIAPVPAVVEGSPGEAYTYTWEQTASPPWDPEAEEIEVLGLAVVVEGYDGYTYGVYLVAPRDNQRSTDAMQAVADSIAVTDA